MTMLDQNRECIRFATNKKIDSIAKFGKKKNLMNAETDGI